jgi:hypothetical protein
MALQIRGEQLTGIKNASIDASAGINLSKLSLSDSATFSGALVLSNNNTHSGILTVSNDTQSTTSSNGSLIVSGGVGIAKDLNLGGSLVIDGDLTVSGTTTSVNTEEIKLADNVIVVNSNATGSATEDGGLEIERGDDDNKSFYWDESEDYWSIDSEKLSAGSFTASGAITGGSLTDGTATLTSGDFTGLSSVSVSGNITSASGTVSGATLSDGTASMSSGTISDGTMSIASGALSSVTTISASGNISSSAGTLSGATLSDGTASLNSGSMSGLVNVTASGIVSFGTLTDSGESIAVTKFVDEADGISDNDNDTSLPTSAAVKDYVDNATASGNLDLSSKVDNSSIELDGDSKISVKDLGVTNAMLAGSIANAKLVNDSLTIGDQEIELGASQDTFTGLASVTSTAFVGDLTGDVTGQVTDITNHDIAQLSDVTISGTEADGNMFFYDSSASSYINVKMVVENHTAGGTQVITLSDAPASTDFHAMAQVFLNGQKMRLDSSGSSFTDGHDYYFSGNGELTFDDVLSAGDNVEVIFYKQQG